MNRHGPGVEAISCLSPSCAVTAVTQTSYSDKNCATAASPVPGFQNPWVIPLNACAKPTDTGYVKYTSCISNGKYVGAGYSDAACSIKQADLSGDADFCYSGASGSSKVTCAPASSATVALAAVAAGTLLLFVQ